MVVANRLVQRPIRTHRTTAGLVAQPHDVAGDGEVHHHHADHAGEDEAFDTALFLDPVEFLASRRVVGCAT